MSGSGLNVSCFPSQMSTDSTTMSGCELKLWTINLIVFAGIAFVSILFLSIVLFCRFHKRKSSKLRLVYETKPKKRIGAQGSVYSVRSQGIMELNLPDPRLQENVIIFGESNLNIEETSQEPQSPPPPLSLPPSSNDAVVAMTSLERVTEEEDIHSHNDSNDVIYDEVDENPIGNFNRVSVMRQSVRSDSGRNTTFVRHSMIRESTRSEAGSVFSKVHHNASSNVTFDCQVSATGNEGNQRHRGEFSRQGSREIQESTDFGNTSNGKRTVLIREVHTQNLPEDRHILISTPDDEINIPGFKDPLDDDDISISQLYINIAPDIYNSQILRTVISPEAKDEETGGGGGDNEDLDDVFYDEGADRHVIKASTRKLVQSISEVLIPLEPDIIGGGSEGVLNTVSDPRYSTIIILDEDSNPPDEDKEVVYDEPLLLNGCGTRQLVPMFDDPGYNKGFKNQNGAQSEFESTESHVYNILESPTSPVDSCKDRDNMAASPSLEITSHTPILAPQYENIIIRENNPDTEALLDSKEEAEFQDLKPERC